MTRAMRTLAGWVLSFAIAVAGTVASAAADQTRFVANIHSASGPLAHARVELRNAGHVYTGTSNAAGRVIIAGVEPGEYAVTLSAAGFATTVTDAVVIAGDYDHTVDLAIAPVVAKLVPKPPPLAPVVAASPPAPPTLGAEPPPPPPPPTTAAPPPKRAEAPPGAASATVDDSVLAIANPAHPIIAGTHPFGRYSYVLLRDDATATAQNTALLTRLAQKYLQGATSLRPGTRTDVDMPALYNLFIVPVKNGVQSIPTTSTQTLVQTLLKNYDYETANAMRATYCNMPKHRTWSPCRGDWDAGPFVLTFLKPVGVGGSYPPALAYDFSRVPAQQIPVGVDDIQQKITYTGVVSQDTVLPPDFVSAYIVPALQVFNQALVSSVPAVQSLISDFFPKN